MNSSRMSLQYLIRQECGNTDFVPNDFTVVRQWVTFHFTALPDWY